VSEHVLDSSAVLALVFDEPGADFVRQVVSEGTLISTISLSEVVAILADNGGTRAQIASILAPVRFEIVAFSEEHAWQAGLLRPVTRQAGLSLGDRACLALGLTRGLPVLTADRVWAQLDVGVEVVVCR
jgi:PIN domain nuclease of toxin-antitoxin system